MRVRLVPLMLLCALSCGGPARSGSVSLEERDSGRSPPQKPRPPRDAGTGNEQDGSTPGPLADAGARGDAGTTPDAGGVCGDGRVAEELEECDGDNIEDNSCFSLGFASGELSCTPLCTFDVSACVASERCDDGRDNDGDAFADCDDSDCEAACESGCAEPVPLVVDEMSGVSTGNNLGHSNELMSGCATGTSGPEVVYEFVPPKDGVLQASLQTSRLLTLSAVRTCEVGVQGAEAECVPPARQLIVPVTANVPVFVVVEGRSESDVGPYELSARFREITCGDGARDEGEGCDDGNERSGDGCALCSVESKEVEPNGQAELASPFLEPMWGELGEVGDVDYISFELTTEAPELMITIQSLGDGACDLNLLDSVLSVFDDQGDEVAVDDDGGPGFCSRVLMRNVSPGNYTVRVEAAVGAQPSTFPYLLKVAR